MERVCYNCGINLSLEEVTKGQEWLDWCNHYPGDFEGWVHCSGSDDKFIQPTDKELLKQCNMLPLATQMNYTHSIIVCVACVKSQFENETGVQMVYEKECGCESIKY